MFTFLSSGQLDDKPSAFIDVDDATSTCGTEDEHQSTSTMDPTDDSSTISSYSDEIDETSRQARPNPEGTGLSDERVCRRQRPLVELIDRLRDIGVQHELDLPVIVVVGPQNVGKSSLFEGISGGIKFPRASGTCTRCPIELRMKRSSGRWRCEVKLQIVYDEEGRQLQHAQTLQFGNPIFDPDEVEDRIKRAQHAILSPSRFPEDFLGIKTPAPTGELAFSKNVISIRIEGPNVVDLSFVDLPGLIASARHGNVADIRLIEDLVTSYIEKTSTLILLTIACESDFATQGAYQLVKKHDPDGVRTIGVLTKPDRIAKGDEDQWVRFIKGEEEQLTLGWFSVKQPDSIQLSRGLSWSQNREEEMEWFRCTKPWSTLPPTYKKKLGTMNLVETLGEKLPDLIAQRLPLLAEVLEVRLQETEEELRKMPPRRSEDALSEMMFLINSFCTHVSRHTEGIPANEGLLQSINMKQDEFRRAVLSQAPKFLPYKQSESAADLPQMPPCEFLDGEEEDVDAAERRMVMDIDEVMDLLKRSRTRELPGYYPYEVPKQITEIAIKRWNVMAFSYFDNVWNLVKGHLVQLIDEYFKHFESGGLYSIVQSQVLDEVAKLRDETLERLKWLMGVMEQPFTLNTRYLAEFKSKFLAYYKMYRYNMTHRDPMMYIQTFNSGRSVNYVGEVLSSLNKMNIKDVKPLDLAKLFPEDDYEPALNLMAVVSAYFQVASKRFIDIVPATIDHDFVRGLNRKLHITLTTAIIKGDARNKCRGLLQESSAVAIRRSELEKKYERLEAARRELTSMRWKELC